MGFIERFFDGKKELNSEDIERFISRRIEESINLDYKDIRAYDDSRARVFSQPHSTELRTVSF